MGQISMFGPAENISPENIRFLNVIQDGKIVEISVKGLFNPIEYDELLAVTYVSSPVFFSKVVKDFKKVQFVLGIPDSDFLNRFAARLNMIFNIEKRLEWWNKLNPVVKEKIQDDSFSVRFCGLSMSIHSKIYLLRNTENGNTRVAIGSANLTETAFKDKKQFEELIIFDNSPLYKIYLDRFNEIYAQTVDYIPETCRKKSPKEIVYTGDAEILASVLMEVVEKDKARIVLTEEQMADLKSLPAEIVYQKEEVDRTKSVIELVTRKKNNTFIPKSNAELKKIFTNIKTQVCRVSKDNQSDTRPFYKYVPGQNSILVCDRENPDIYKSYSQPATSESIKKSLTIIDKFIEAYRLFTIRPTLANQSKVFEIILYSFMSPFLWKIREDYVLQKGRESVRADIPIFLFIAGRAKSGKSTALEFIGMLTGAFAPFYVPYKNVEKTLLDCFYTENLCPRLVDEIHPSFFRSTALTKGEALIKHLSNDLSGQHPALIGTTNAQDFSVPSQIHRRVYYIQIDKTFDLNKFRGECNEYFTQVISEIDDSLFKDFLYRVTQRLEGDFYNPRDFLSLAREIFENYYSECGMDLPEWFPRKLFNDLDERGKNIWRELYNRYGKEAFRERNDGIIFVDTSVVFSSEINKKNLLNYLDTSTIKEDSQILCLNAAEFYDFIGLDQKGLLYKLKRIFK